MQKASNLSKFRLVSLVSVIVAGMLVIYNFTFDRNTAFQSENVLEQIAKDPEFTKHFGAGLATITKLDTDKDGIPDVSDSDIDNDGIPNAQDDDVDGDGTPNAEDPSSALVALVDQIGLKGDKGDQGNDGTEGLAGTDGDIGSEGDDGDVGTDGNNGLNGGTGDDGDNGLNGGDGSDGDQGDDGSEGDDGANGSDGTSGAVGATGQDGVDGTNGVDGIDGATGAQGIQGIQGATGATGTVGVVTDDGVIDTTLTGSTLDVQILLATGSGLEKLGTGLSLDTSCSSGQVLKWSGTAWACASDIDTDTNTTYTASTGVTISTGMISAVLGTSIDSSEITNSTITTDDIAANTIAAADIATGAVESAEIANGTIVSEDIGNSQVTNAKVADDTLDFDVFADALVVDAATTVGVTDSNTFGITRSSGGQLLTFADGTDDHGYYSGAGTPEGSVAADTGSLYVDTSNAVLYIKGDDTDNDTWAVVGGGLSRRGTITADPAPALAESIYTADASGGAFNVTLPAATGSQARVTLIGGDVEINDVTVAVQLGEALNEVTDGTFTLDTDGERLEAIDRGTGLWDLSVVGAATQTNLSRSVHGKNVQAGYTTGQDVLWNAASLSQGSKISYDGTSAWTLEPGTYRLWSQIHIDSFTATVNGYIATDWVDAGTNVILPTSNQAAVRAANDSDSHGSTPIVSAIVEVTTPMTVKLRSNTSNSTGTIVSISQAVIEELPSSETVLAGMITPETLIDAEVINAVTDSTTSGTFGDVTELSITIPADGKYIIGYETDGSVTNNSNATRYLETRLFDNTATGVVANSTRGIASGETSGTATNSRGSTHFSTVVTVSAGQSYQMQYRGVGGNTGQNVSVYSGSKMFYRQVPSSQVVDPGDVPVGDLHRVRMRRDAAQALPSGTTDILLDAEDYDVGNIGDTGTGTVTIAQDGAYRITAHGTNVTASNNTQVYIKVNGATVSRNINSQSTGGSIDALSDTITLELTAGDTVNMGMFFLVAGNTSTLAADRPTLEVIQIADKTVIDSDDVTVNDQTASGYYDIGNMRVQWGYTTVSGAGAAQTIVSYPQAFGAAPNVTATLQWNYHAATNNSLTTRSLVTEGSGPTSFTVRGVDNVNVLDGIQWQAIGLKP